MNPSFALIACLVAATNAATLHLLEDFPQARCMDGSRSGFYIDRATTQESANKWIIHLEGGGECASEDRCKSIGVASNPLGSSKPWPAERSLGFYSHADCSINPDYCTWNRVLLAYCSQDLHSGQRVTPSNESWNLIFAGREIFVSTVQALSEDYNMTLATDMILSGDSAGGIGVWHHLDDLASKFPKARVTGAPIAGFYFFAHPYEGVNHTSSGLADFREPAWPGHVALWDSYMDQTCVAALGSSSGACMLSNNSFPYISSSVFVTQAQTDQVVILYHDWMPEKDLLNAPEEAYLEDWHHNMTDVALHPIIASTTGKDGLFNAACFIHTGFFYDHPLIQGVSYLQAHGNWYFKREGPAVLYDDCGILCNPKCT